RCHVLPPRVRIAEITSGPTLARAAGMLTERPPTARNSTRRR
ncbi:MAG: hypothetical protein ACI8S6_003295, partial [Myxococcota bacterium]